MFGELIQSASFSVTFAFVASRLAQLASLEATLKPSPSEPRTRADVQSSRPGTPLPPRPYLSYRRAKAAKQSGELGAKRILLRGNPYGALH